MCDITDIHVPGRGLYCPAADEAALKIKKIAYIRVGRLAGNEMKHGPLAQWRGEYSGHSLESARFRV